MQIKAISQIIEFDAESGGIVVINEGAEGNVPDAFGQRMIEEGRAELTEALDQLDHDGDGEPGGSVAPDATADLVTLREAYVQVLGKKPFPGWDADELQRRIDAAADDAQDGPPA